MIDVTDSGKHGGSVAGRGAGWPQWLQERSLAVLHGGQTAFEPAAADLMPHLTATVQATDAR